MRTIFALSSGAPPAAIAVIRVSGPSAHAAAQAMCGILPEPKHAAVRVVRDPASGEDLDEALVLRFDGPQSATGEDLVEFHCHGGRAVIDSILAALERQSELIPAEPGEFTRRAFENGRIDLTEAEGLADLLEAETETQRRAALTLTGGALRRMIEDWRLQLLRFSAEAEMAIDYVGEDQEAGSIELRDRIRSLTADILMWLQRPRIEPLKDGVKVVIAGPPNSGKSSLLNALVGHDRAIVGEVAGTTRDHIDVPLAIRGIPFLLTDTAGLRDTADCVEAEGVDRAHRLIQVADIVLWLGEPRQAPVHPAVHIVGSKADLLPAKNAPPGRDIWVSAKSGTGLAELLDRLIGLAKDKLPTEGALALNARQAAELENAHAALSVSDGDDLVILAEGLRQARDAFDRITGRAGVEDFLDTLFLRFCLGK